RLETPVLQMVDVLAQVAGTRLGGALAAPRHQELAQTLDVATVRIQRARREAALEGEVVPELREVIRGAHSRCLRVVHHQTITRAKRTTATQKRTWLVRSNASRMACQFRPAAAPKYTSRPYQRAEADARGGSTRIGRTR